MKPILIVKAGGTYPDIAARWGDFEEAKRRIIEGVDRAKAEG